MENMFVYVSLAVIVVLISFSNQCVNGSPEFSINYANNTFLKDGQPFRYVSGSMHYSRVHPLYWQDRLRKMRAAGLNAVQTYVPWNVHQPLPGNFKWDGFSDLGRFLSLAKEEDLVVLLRLGPYICGEWEFGGFPAWLLTEDPKMVLRSSDPSYMKWVILWFQGLLPKVKPFLYENGGPVVMVQIENEYGSYFACDKKYMLSLRDLVTSALGSDVVLYTTDGAGDGYLKCGATDGVYATVDFGVTYNASKAFKPQRDYEPRGPLVNSEFYTGWLDHWGSKHSTTSASSISKSLDILLDYNSSNVNMYMFVGSTNFGFWNGANEPAYAPVPTSYDYDSPINEAGDITLKFYAIRDIVSKYLPLPTSPIPANTTKMNYGAIPMNFLCTVQDALSFLNPEGPTKAKYPVSMEKIKFYKGFILYRHVLKANVTQPTELLTSGVRDRAMVMVDGVPMGILDREAVTSINITGSKGQSVDFLVENQGRVGYGTDMNFNTKGLTRNVTLGGEMLADWIIYPLHMDNVNKSFSDLPRYVKSNQLKKPLKSSDGSLTTPSFYFGDIAAPYGSPEIFNDTFLDPRPFTKGQAFINDFNLGRYWPNRGPQVRLYVPKPVFQPSTAINRLYLFEVESSPCNHVTSQSGCKVSLVDQPYLDGPVGPQVSGSLQFRGKDVHISTETLWDSSLQRQVH